MSALRERWAYERQSIDCAALARHLIGREPDKLESRYACWRCPFHDERTPSFKVTLGAGGRWKCFGCNESGDAADLIQKLCNCDFTEARARLLGISVFDPSRSKSNESAHVRTPSFKTSAPTPETPRARFTAEEAEAFYAQSRETLAGDRGRAAKAALVARGISEDTANQAGIGYALADARVPWKSPGIVIPWYRCGDLSMLKLRVDEDHAKKFSEDKRPPKYLEIWRHPDKRMAPVVFPDTRHYPFRREMPCVIVEGELDCVLLTQELAGLGALVLTLGAASQVADRDGTLKRDALELLHLCGKLIIALDADEAGERAAARFLDRPNVAFRVTPPAGKDWTEAKSLGVNVRELFAEELRWSADT